MIICINNQGGSPFENQLIGVTSIIEQYASIFGSLMNEMLYEESHLLALASLIWPRRVYL